MEEKSKIAPFIVKPQKISNYTHLITLLKLKQKKYAAFTHGVVCGQFSHVLGSYKEKIDLDQVFQGFLHDQLKSKLSNYETSVYNELESAVDAKIKAIKEDNDQKIYANKIGNIKEQEDLLFSKPSLVSFKDEMLFDLYSYLFKRSTPLEFLQSAYLKYILKFFCENHPDGVSIDRNSENIPDGVLKNIVMEFVKMRFNTEEFRIEIFESRYLWAEVFVLFRIGRSDLVLDLLNQHETFFEYIAHKFKSAFTSFLNHGRLSSNVSIRNEDKFKKFLFEMMEDKAKSDGQVISSVEDYLWLKLVTDKDVKTDINRFDSAKIKIMISLFAKKYNTAIDTLLKSDYSIVSKFFILRELCLEQRLDTSIINVENFNSSALGGDQSSNFRFFKNDKEKSVDNSFISTNNGINPVFLNFLFSLVTKLSSQDKKVKLIEILKASSEYYDIVPRFIIKYDLFDVLGKSKAGSNLIEYALDDKISYRVLSLLKESGDKNKIIQLHSLIDDVSMVQYLKDVTEEAILIDGKIDEAIAEKYLKVVASKDTVEFQKMYAFYLFINNPSLESLKRTVIFDQSENLRSFRFVIEKIFSKAVEVIKYSNCPQMAKQLFKICGALDLSDECTAKISKDLVLLL